VIRDIHDKSTSRGDGDLPASCKGMLMSTPVVPVGAAQYGRQNQNRAEGTRARFVRRCGPLPASTVLVSRSARGRICGATGVFKFLLVSSRLRSSVGNIFVASRPGFPLQQNQTSICGLGVTPSPMIELWFNRPALKQLVEVSGARAPYA